MCSHGRNTAKLVVVIYIPAINITVINESDPKVISFFIKYNILNLFLHIQLISVAVDIHASVKQILLNTYYVSSM